MKILKKLEVINIKPNLDERKIDKFRDLVNSTNIFYKDDKYKTYWNMICAFMDRIDDAIKFLNSTELINDENGKQEDFIIFMVYCDIIVSSIEKLSKRLSIDLPMTKDSNIFNEVGDGTGNDDLFFKHIRHLSFAHSIETSHKSPYVEKGEIKYSPYIINGGPFDIDSIVITVYSTIPEKDDERLVVSKKSLIEYIEKKYNLLDYLINYLESEIVINLERLQSDIIEITENPITTLKNLKIAAVKRYDDSLIKHIDECIYILEYTTENDRNQSAVNKFKEYLIGHLDDFIELYQNVDPEIEAHVFKSYYFKWNIDLSNANYIMEKIRLYLTEDHAGENTYIFDPTSDFNPCTTSSVDWGFQQLRIFKRTFSDNIVDINYTDSFKDIQLLVTTALYIDNLDKGLI